MMSVFTCYDPGWAVCCVPIPVATCISMGVLTFTALPTGLPSSLTGFQFSTFRIE